MPLAKKSNRDATRPSFEMAKGGVWELSLDANGGEKKKGQRGKAGLQGHKAMTLYLRLDMGNSFSRRCSRGFAGDEEGMDLFVKPVEHSLQKSGQNILCLRQQRPQSLFGLREVQHQHLIELIGEEPFQNPCLRRASNRTIEFIACIEIG